MPLTSVKFDFYGKLLKVNVEMTKLINSRLLLFFACVAVLGCAKSEGVGRTPTKPVTVLVTYRGNPVDGATVTFIDENGKAPAYGRTDSRGRAKMKTYKEGDGAVVGRHKVTINKLEAAADGEPDQDSPEYFPPELSNKPAPEVKNHIPVKYSSPATSDLEAEVNSSGVNLVKFDLTD